MTSTDAHAIGRDDPALTAPNEASRLAALHRLRALDSGPDPRFDRIARLAALLFATPRAAIVLIDEDRMWLKAAVGIARDPLPRAGTVADAAMQYGEPIFAPDIRGDRRFQGATGQGSEEVRFYAAAPLTAPGGQIVGILGVADTVPRNPPSEAERGALVDLAALAMEELVRDAEVAAARELSAVSQERVDLALTVAGLAAYEWNQNGELVAISDEAIAMVGWTSTNQADRQSVFALIHPEDNERVIAALRADLREHGRYDVEFRMVRPDDGRTIWVSTAGALVAAPDGTPGRVIGVIQDITVRKTEEEQRETLVAELDHRVKNVLAAVQSMAAQSARKASSLDGFLKTFAGRLKSMASAHQLLTATRWRGAGMQNIAAAELGGLAPGQTRWQGPDILLTPRATNAMSLALHELATNAVKFGALSTDAGRIDVTWRGLEGGGLELQWLESRGPIVTPPTRRGFGSTLLEKVTGRELEGAVRLEHRGEGVRALLTVGAAAIAAPAVAAPVVAGDRPPPPASAGPTIAGASAGAPQQAARVQGLRLLIVEDALLLALELEAGLQEAGASVLGSAADVDEAMRMINLPIDAAVLDANLNGASVLPVAEALAARGIPFVFATGYGDDNNMPMGFGAPIIRKPYDVTQVAAALAEVTGRA
jgi:PAS domain S-box-containing protein